MHNGICHLKLAVVMFFFRKVWALPQYSIIISPHLYVASFDGVSGNNSSTADELMSQFSSESADKSYTTPWVLLKKWQGREPGVWDPHQVYFCSRIKLKQSPGKAQAKSKVKSIVGPAVHKHKARAWFGAILLIFKHQFVTGVSFALSSRA